MLTKQDMKQLEEKFATKKELTDGLDKVSTQIIDAMNAMGDMIITKLQGEIQEVKKEIKVHNDILEDHERDIDKLKQAVNLPA